MSGEERNSILKEVVIKGGSMEYMKLEAENIVKHVMAGTVSVERVADALTVRDKEGTCDLNFG